MRGVAALAAVVLAAGCTTTNVMPVQERDLDYVCIKRNPKVIVDGFERHVQVRLSEHGVASEVYVGSAPAHCRYTMYYSARRSWDFATFLAYAGLDLYRGNTLVGSVRYSTSNSFNFNKYRSYQAKIDPLIAELLAERNRRPRSTRVGPTSMEQFSSRIAPR